MNDDDSRADFFLVAEKRGTASGTASPAAQMFVCPHLSSTDNHPVNAEDSRARAPIRWPPSTSALSPRSFSLSLPVPPPWRPRPIRFSYCQGSPGHGRGAAASPCSSAPRRAPRREPPPPPLLRKGARLAGPRPGGRSGSRAPRWAGRGRDRSRCSGSSPAPRPRPSASSSTPHGPFSTPWTRASSW